MTKIPMTTNGARALEQELSERETVTRSRIVNSIAEARAHGDLKENAEYHAAKEEQGFNEGRIQEIKSRLANAQIIDITKLTNSGKVIFGATVHLLNTATEQVTVYQIVGEDEADIKAGKISISSPIARAFISKEEGDIIVAQIPSGEVEYELTKVEYI